MLPMKRSNIVNVISLIVICFNLTGCALLIVPVAGLIGHGIQKSNEEYDEIVVNMGMKYKQYYNEALEDNEKNISAGQKVAEIMKFSDWIETQATSEIERKAVARYKRINRSNQ